MKTAGQQQGKDECTAVSSIIIIIGHQLSQLMNKLFTIQFIL